MDDKSSRARLSHDRPKRRRPRRPRLGPPSQTAVLDASFGLAKELSLEMHEEELVARFVDVLARLLPGRMLCLRVIDPRSFELTALIADGPLLERRSSMPLELKRAALDRTHLPQALSASSHIRLTDSYHPVFAGAGGGFSVPLVAAGQIFGLLNVEYAAPHDLSASDEPVVIPLVNQMSVALRNLDLLGRARYYQDYLHQMIAVANALIVVIDRHGRIAVMNNAFLLYGGYPASMIGTSLQELRSRSTAPEPRLGTLLLQGLVGVEHSDVEVTLVRHDGTHCRTVFSTSVLRAPDDSIDGVIAIGQDRERIVSLERQVTQAEKLATLGQLAAGVVHELNNPLTSISVYADYLVRVFQRQGAADNLDRARKIVEGAARIQKLTRDLVSYARPAGEFELVALNEVARQALSFCEHELGRARARVTLELADGLPRARAIKTQLHQVVINLLTNACHALKPGGGRVCVATSLGSGGEVCLSVRDDGAGIAAADQARIFEPFFTTKDNGKGTGLGLSIVKNIVEGHGGRIRCESAPGSTIFTLRLPPGEAPPAAVVRARRDRKRMSS